ncbi:MAG: hypothetical protein KA244_05120 [Deltaproteobacteria bacterium]|jgi:hypothetical protein|nr:hypothetical protein [Deltaproteobacteria bacterium]
MNRSNVFNRLARFALASSLAVAGLLWAAPASATNYTLWIHGRGGAASAAGNYANFGYWGPATASAGVNKKAVNWDGTQSIASTNLRVRNALDCFCTGSNSCYIAVHSAGDLQIGYTLANYGSSLRVKSNATPDANGVCGSAGTGTQTGWNIKSVYVASGASGGSELSDYGSWASSEPLTKDLKTTTARAMYDHNQTRGLLIQRYAGASGTLYSGILPGQDDEAVAYHTTGGVSGSAGAGFGNPTDWLSNDLTMGTAACEGGATKWTNHTVRFRDNGEVYNHYANGNWLGIIAPVRSDVAAYAK